MVVITKRCYWYLMVTISDIQNKLIQQRISNTSSNQILVLHQKESGIWTKMANTRYKIGKNTSWLCNIFWYQKEPCTQNLVRAYQEEWEASLQGLLLANMDTFGHKEFPEKNIYNWTMLNMYFIYLVISWKQTWEKEGERL